MIRKVMLLGGAVLAVVVLGAQLVSSSMEASAETSGRLQSPIAAGSDEQVIGTATMEWVLADDGHQTANFIVDLTTTGRSYTVEHLFVCLSTEAFSGRVNPAKCTMPPRGFQSDPGTPIASASIPLGIRTPRPPEGPPLCAQVHVDTTLGSRSGGSATAFAGWQDGKPFYGSLCFPASHLPPGAVGVVVLAGVLGVAFLVVHLRRRSSRPLPVG